MVLSEHRAGRGGNNLFSSREKSSPHNTHLASIPLTTAAGKKSSALILSLRQATIGGHLHPVAPKLHLDLLGTPSSVANPSRSLERQTKVMGRIKKSLRAINHELDARGAQSERKLPGNGAISAREANG